MSVSFLMNDDDFLTQLSFQTFKISTFIYITSNFSYRYQYSYIYILQTRSEIIIDRWTVRERERDKRENVTHIREKRTKNDREK